MASTSSAVSQNRHCPLCVPSMVHPKEDSQKPALIFLDMDGVMDGNLEKVETELKKMFPDAGKSPTDYQWIRAKGRNLNQTAADNLHTLIDRIKKAGQRPLIVLSSNWRNDATLEQHRREIFFQYRFSHHLCGKTAPLFYQGTLLPKRYKEYNFTAQAQSSCELILERRANTIEYWLKDHDFPLDSTNFVVIDDDPYADLERFKGRFIETKTQFTEENVKQACSALGIK